MLRHHVAQREGGDDSAAWNRSGGAEIVAVAAREAAVKAGLAPPTLDGVLALRGVVEVVESVEDDEAAVTAACAGALASLDEAIAALTAGAARGGCGARLGA